jgi:DNA-binding transcriptional regulator LsrR (DeoR family)
VTTHDHAAVRREIAARRRAQVFQMRREGASLDSIASRLGVSRASVRKMVAREVAALSAEAQPDERRIVHAEALMDIWRVLYAPATQGDLAAIDRFLRVEERLSRLLGLDRQQQDASAEQALRIVVGPEGEDAAPADEPSRRFRRDPAGVTTGDDGWEPPDLD